MLEIDHLHCTTQAQNIFRKPDIGDRKQMPLPLKNTDIFAEYVSCLLIIHDPFYLNKIILGHIKS